MSKRSGWFKGLAGLLVVAALVLALSWLFGGLGQAPRGGQEAAPTNTFLPERQVVPPPPPMLAPTPGLEPYPPPPIQPTTLPIPTVVTATATALPTLPDTPPVPGKAATLFDGNVWLVELGRVPEAVTDVGDVAAIFGWNWDGTKLLIGRGWKQHEWEFISDTTDLWVIKLANRTLRQLTTGSNVHTAVWSPVEDRLAYCDQEAGVRIVSDTGELLYELTNGECIRSTWSPDGTRLATATSSAAEDPRPYDELENARLVILKPSDGTSTVLTDEGIPHAPVWSMNGEHILFQLALANQSFGESPWYLADTITGDVTRLDNAPPFAGMDPLRSPRGDFIVVGIGEEFYVLDFAGNTLFTAPGRGPVWAPDGQTIVYQDEAGRWQAVTVPLEVRGDKVGGGLPAPVLFDYLQWKFFFVP